MVRDVDGESVYMAGGLAPRANRKRGWDLWWPADRAAYKEFLDLSSSVRATWRPTSVGFSQLENSSRT